MSEKKKLKQSRLPFQVISSVAVSAVASKPIETLSPSPDVTTSRKRRPSVEAENNRSTKIGKVLDSKENISIQEKIVLIEDSNDGCEPLENMEDVVDDPPNVSITSKVEAEPATKKKTTEKSVLQIKLPTKRKNAELVTKSVNSTEEMHDDDSVVYLDAEDILKSSKKSKRSSKKVQEKKKDVKKTEAKLQLEEVVEEIEDIVVEIMDDTPPNVTLECTAEKNTPIKSSEKKTKSPSSSKKSKSPSKPEVVEDEDVIEKDGSEDGKDVISLDSDSSGENKTKLSDSILDKSLTSIIQADGDVAKKPLTPKQIKRREFFEEKRLEKERQRQKEREEREEARKKERDVREDAKKQEREEKETQRRVERDEKEKKRLAELDLKNEEKRAKEEERKKRQDQIDEERKKKDETQKKKDLEKEEIENRKKRAAQQFTKFFVPKTKPVIAATATEDEMSIDSTEDVEQSVTKSCKFKPFQLKVAMTLAPHVRIQITKKQLSTLDEALKVSKNKNELYLKKLKSNSYTPFRSVKVDDSEDVQFIDDQDNEGDNIMVTDNKCNKNINKLRAKFLSFTENRRPAFYGTWGKKSACITARKPLGQDECFDYEVDSDDEWEEEEPGESLHGSDDEKDKDSENEEYDVDNDFFVPHGHLSDEELQQDEDIEEDNSPEAQKAKLKILQQEFADEMKKKTIKIKPRLIGCIWMQGNEDENGGTVKGNGEKSYHCSNIIWRILKAREMLCADEEIVIMEKIEPKILQAIVEAEIAEKTPTLPKRIQISDESVKDLITLVHGNTNNRKFLIREFQAFRLKNYFNDPDYQEFSIRSVQEKLSEICAYQSCPVDGVMFGKKCWYVKPEIQKKYFGDNETINLPNEWNYILEIKRKTLDPVPKKIVEISPPASIKKIITTPKVVKVIEPKKINPLGNFLKATQKTP